MEVIIKLKLLFVLLIVSLTNTSYSQDVWNNLTLPATLNTPITSSAVSGNDIYLGTNGQGVFYTNDSGQNWSNNSIPGMTTDSINKILISPNGPVFALGTKTIFKTLDKGGSWNILDNFHPNGNIQCAAISLLGSIVVGTNTEIWFSVFHVNGGEWQTINGQIGAIDVRAIIFDKTEQIFLSGIYNVNPTIYLIDNGGVFTRIIETIAEPPLVTDFTLDETGIVSAAVGSSVYQFQSNTHLWSSLTISDQPNINKIRFTKIGDLLSFDRYKLKIFDRKKNIWYPEHPDFVFNRPIIDAMVEDNYTWVVQPEVIGRVRNDGIINLILSKHFLVLDDKGNPMKNKTFDLYLASCDNNQITRQWVTTGRMGTFNLNYESTGLLAGVQIKLEKKVFTELAVKTGHEEFANKMHDIYLNNMKFDGAGNPSYYTLTDESNQTIIMDHTIIHRFLVVSVEWEAKKAYLDSLASWCKYMSEFLYDVTDGQLFVEGVSINDNLQKWNQADIRIFANNQVWANSAVDGIHSPDADQAQVRIPRRWFGNLDGNRLWSVRSDWFTTDDALLSLYMSTTIAHELGHYMFGFYDEYVWTNEDKHKLLPAGYNFGFMQYQFQNAPDWSSEMSDPNRYSNTDYRYTAQWVYNGSDCWTQFKNKYEKYYSDVSGDDIWLPVKMPSERTLDAGIGFLRGPMDFLTGQNQCSIRQLVKVNIHDQNIGSGDFAFTVLDNNGLNAGKADVYDLAPFFNTYLPKTYQGQTSDDGKMIVLGANVNDKIIITKKTEIDLGFGIVAYTYLNKELIVNAITGVKNDDDSPMSDNVIQLDAVKGENRLINTMRYDTFGNVDFKIYTEKSFNALPSLDFQLPDSTIKNTEFIYNAAKSIYSLSIYDSLPDQNPLFFKAVDSVNKPFSILFDYSLSHFAKNISAPGGTAELILDSNNKSINFVSTLTSNFPPLKNGIPKNAKQGGSVVSISTFPGTIEPQTTNILNIRYSALDMLPKEESSLSIFKWNETNLVWDKISSNLDTAMKTVYAPINSDGTYAAFATYITTGMLDKNNSDYFSLDAYPNPVTSMSQIQFYLPDAGNTSLSLFNAMGQEMMTFVDRYLNYGKQSFHLNSATLESGVYYLRLKVNDKIATKKIIVIK